MQSLQIQRLLGANEDCRFIRTNQSIDYTLRDRCRFDWSMYRLERQLPLARAFRYNNNRDRAYYNEGGANERLRFTC